MVLNFCHTLKQKNKDVPVIIISGHANIEMAIKALHHGAFEFIEKTVWSRKIIKFYKACCRTL